MADALPPPADLGGLNRYSVHDRPHLVAIDRLGGAPDAGVSFAEWAASLPGFLGVERLRELVACIIAARRAERAVVIGMGAHAIKVGCGPVLIDLMRRGVVTAIACNGATAIHDVEIATVGATSEDVAASIRDGSFGMVRETMDFFAKAARRAVKQQRGLGPAVGDLLLERKAPNNKLSLFASAVELNIPITVHVAVGTDTIHMAPEMDGAALGEATMIDFRRLCTISKDLGAASEGGAGGVWCNVGSTVVMPEVFLKAVAVARNLGANLDDMNTVNFDMIRHYRPTQNVLHRPVVGGKSFELTGHHEMMLPLLRQMIVEAMAR